MISVNQKINKKSLLIFLVFFFLFIKLDPTAAASFDTTSYKFSSCLDGDEDFYSLHLSKSLKPSEVLIVYLHGLTGDYTELYKSNLAEAINRAFPSVSLLSCNYGHMPSWGNSVARIDITNNIRQVMRKIPIKHIVLVGTSMGGSTALTYAATAPLYIKGRICGIVAVAPCADLEDLYQKATGPEVKPSLEKAFGNTATENPGLYRQNSLDTCVAYLPQSTKIAVITAKEDTFIPVELQADVVRDLNNRDLNTKMLELDGKSEPPPVDSIMEGLHFVLQ